MKIAATFENGTIFGHFGHTRQFKVYDVEAGKVVGERVVDTNGSGHGALAGFLADLGVDTLENLLMMRRFTAIIMMQSIRAGIVGNINRNVRAIEQSA